MLFLRFLPPGVIKNQVIVYEHSVKRSLKKEFQKNLFYEIRVCLAIETNEDKEKVLKL